MIHSDTSPTDEIKYKGIADLGRLIGQGGTSWNDPRNGFGGGGLDWIEAGQKDQNKCKKEGCHATRSWGCRRRRRGHGHWDTRPTRNSSQKLSSPQLTTRSFETFCFPVSSVLGRSRTKNNGTKKMCSNKCCLTLESHCAGTKKCVRR